ncbi:tRNA 2'-phosphotransferase 1 [Chamberlinius hualienensis]
MVHFNHKISVDFEMDRFRENIKSESSSTIRNLVHLSKSLSWLLRHGAQKEKVEMNPEGYMYVEDILKHKSFAHYSEDLIREVVDGDEKQRFNLRMCPSFGKLQIRANQGHSFDVEKLQLEPILNASHSPVAIHGTTRKNWEKIKSQGLSRMNRNHIHFTPAEPGSKQIISGFRSSSEVLIYLHVEKVLKDGIQLFRSTNNVILSPGNDQGFISPKYFKKIEIL